MMEFMCSSGFGAPMVYVTLFLCRFVMISGKLMKLGVSNFQRSARGAEFSNALKFGIVVIRVFFLRCRWLSIRPICSLRLLTASTLAPLPPIFLLS